MASSLMSVWLWARHKGGTSTAAGLLLPLVPTSSGVDALPFSCPHAAQDKLAECAADCAQEYERQIPKLQRDIVDRLKTIQ